MIQSEAIRTIKITRTHLYDNCNGCIPLVLILARAIGDLEETNDSESLSNLDNQLTQLSIQTRKILKQVRKNGRNNQSEKDNARTLWRWFRFKFR